MLNKRHLFGVGLLLVMLLAFGVACGDDEPAGSTPTTSTSNSQLSQVEIAPLPTLYPTATNPAGATPTVTRSNPFEITATPIDFGQVVIFVRYEIPALGLARVLEGNVSSQLTIRDEMTGVELEKSNQAGVLLDLQSVFSALDVVDYPTDCPSCVRIEYVLPLEGINVVGWLRDEQILASLENYFAANLGPHFPPNTAVGLRRGASTTDAAHTIAVTTDGQIWRWTAIESEVGPSLPAGTVGADLLAQATAAAQSDALGSRYVVDCPGKPIESLWLAGNGEREGIQVTIRCPEYGLPTSLTTLYRNLETVLTDQLSGDKLPLEIAPPIALDNILHYATEQGRLALHSDGTLIATNGVMTSTTFFTATTVISLTEGVYETGRLPLITDSIANRHTVEETPAGERLLVIRTPDGVFALTWQGGPPAALAEFVSLLDEQLSQLLIDETIPDETETPAATAIPEEGTATATPEEEDGVATPVPTATAEP